MTFRIRTESVVVPEGIIAKVEIHSTNSAVNADGLSLIVRTCSKGKPEVRPPRCNVWSRTPTSTLAVDSDLSDGEGDETS